MKSVIFFLTVTYILISGIAINAFLISEATALFMNKPVHSICFNPYAPNYFIIDTGTQSYTFSNFFSHLDGLFDNAWAAFFSLCTAIFIVRLFELSNL